MARSYEPTTGRMGLVWDVVPGMNLPRSTPRRADPPAGVLSTATFANVRDNTELTTGRLWRSRQQSWTLGAAKAQPPWRPSITRKNIATPRPQQQQPDTVVGEQSSKGVELASRAAPHARWQLQGNVVRTQARYENFVQAAFRWLAKRPNTPQTVANLWVSYAPDADMDSQRGRAPCGQGVCQCRQHATLARLPLLDLGVAWKLRPATTLTARLRNATDRIYAANAGSGQNLAPHARWT